MLRRTDRNRWLRPRRQGPDAAADGLGDMAERDAEAGQPESAGQPGVPRGEAADLDIAPNDPLLAYFTTAHGTVDLDSLELDSPALEALRAEGARLVVPLVSQGELIGLLRLGPRRSEQDYSRDDRKLLDDLAAHAAPAVRVAQLVREQQAELRQRERIEQEMAVAQLIQQQFLPNDLPDLPGWHVAAYYRPARAVGGDFYDFIALPGGQVGIVVGDVTDKGVPAALVMATTHSLLRAEAPRLVAPADVLQRVNELLVGELPAHMFVTCLYAVLDLAAGRLRFANAGHNLPYLSSTDGVTELRATGMPLGLLAGMNYEEREATFGPGDRLLLHSDGLAEAHAPEGGEMFGFPRLAGLCGDGDTGEALIDRLLSELAAFTGPGWEQEDDITLVTLQRTGQADDVATLDEFEVPSEQGIERAASDRVLKATAGLGLPDARTEQLRTAVAEAVMNAAEHGNRNQPELPVGVRVTASHDRLEVAVTDSGGNQPLPEAAEPDLDAKLAGRQGPRGWGLFLIRNMVDDLRTSSDGLHHTVHLVMHLHSAAAGRETADGSD
jgi:serine phosphatase RsbU (regulator of sigma subunit)/anti-sigma regulatory factor (Ser/Thr protein kinase)